MKEDQTQQQKRSGVFPQAVCIGIFAMYIIENAIVRAESLDVYLES